MIYTPQEHPEQALITIAFMVLLGIFGGVFFHKVFTVISLIFWMQYTLVLAILQVVRHSHHESSSVTGALLNPFTRFVIFETLALIGLVAVVKYNKIFVGVFILIVWLIFALNFYIFYKTVSSRHVERTQD